MPYFADLTDYRYFASATPSRVLNVGWLDEDHAFEIDTPSAVFLDALWDHGTVSVTKTRGWHECPFCPRDALVHVVRGETRYWLGTAEIRVFDPVSDIVFAAPDLLQHYVRRHRYRPPDAFIAAAIAGPRPPSAEHTARLRALGADAHATRPLTLPRQVFRAVHTPTGPQRVEVPVTVVEDRA